MVDLIGCVLGLSLRPSEGDKTMIINGDASALPLADASVRLVVTSPPYFALRDYGVPGEIGQESSPSEYLAALLCVFRELRRVLTGDGSVFVVLGDKYARTGGVGRKPRGEGRDPGGRRHARPVQRGVPGVRDGSLVGTPWRLALALIDEGWFWRQEIVWRKPNPLPESVRNRCVRSHETIMHFALRANPYVTPAPGGGYGHDVWDIPVGTYRDPDGVRHPAVFPEALVDRVVYGWSAPGDIVLDPFAGSGTVPAVAGGWGRRGIGVELGFDFARVAKRRLG